MAATWGEKLKKVRQFVFHDVWDIDLTSLSLKRGFLVRGVRVAQLVMKGFQEDDLAVHASSLTFVTLTSLVPILAVAFALLKGFGFGQEQINALMTWNQSMPLEFQEFVNQILKIVNSTNFSALGWIGLAAFLLTAVMVLASVENSFNRIWGVTKPRTYLRQMANYIAVLVLVPFLVGIASTIGAYLKGGEAVLPAQMGWLVHSALGVASLFTAWLAFWFLYVFVPNTRVRFVPAVISSLITALTFLAWQKIYIALQVGVARYNAIYGTFASVPIFLAWLYVSWVIVLLGTELAFAIQNSATYQMESTAEAASCKSRILLALAVVRQAAGALVNHAPYFETSAFARDQRVPIRLVNSIVRILVKDNILAEIAERQGCYVLLKAPDTIKVIDIVGMVMQEGSQPEKLGLMHLDPSIDKVLATLDKGLNESLVHLTLQDLLKSNEPH
jgi:membrane protein